MYEFLLKSFYFLGRLQNSNSKHKSYMKVLIVLYDKIYMERIEVLKRESWAKESQ